jgi:PAS domain S-box-containing protein
MRSTASYSKNGRRDSPSAKAPELPIAIPLFILSCDALFGAQAKQGAKFPSRAGLKSGMGPVVASPWGGGNLSLARARNAFSSERLPASIDPDNVVAEHPWSLLAAIVESCLDPIISKDLNGIITSWNPAATRLFGYSPEEAIGQSILILIPNELRYTEREILRRIREGRRIERYETVRVTKSGERVDLMLSISPIRDNRGRVIGASKIAHDISDRKRADEARSRLAAIVESSDDAIISKNLDGIVTSWNGAARRMFGYVEEEMVGQPMVRIIPPEMRNEEADMVLKLRAGERIDHFETNRMAKDGSRIDVSLSTSPMLDPRGRVIGMSMIARDISSRKKIERLLIESEKIAATGRMAATIAHEINNPLEAVMNLIYLARVSSPEDTDLHRYLKAAENEVERVSHIARSTLGFYRDRGEPVELLLHELAEAVLLTYESRLTARHIEVECDFRQTRPILVNRGQIIQVFSNIIANAVDAMPRGGKIRIRVEDAGAVSGPSVRVTIEDEGTGIEERHLPRVFEPFFTTKPDVGTGIGLWVTRRLLENRGGRIEIASSTVAGRSGTKVTFEIPHECVWASNAKLGENPAMADEFQNLTGGRAALLD